MNTDGPAFPSGHILHNLGVTKGAVRRVTFSNLILGVTAAGCVAWAVAVTWTVDRRIERYVVVLGEESYPLLAARIGHDNWTPTNGFLVKFAQDWVRNVRSRPSDPETLKYQWNQVIRTSDQRLHQRLLEAVRDAEETIGSKTVSVLSISANVVEGNGNRATMLVNWTEKVEGSVEKKPRSYTATLTLVAQQPLTQGDARREFERNPTGVYVTSFQPTLMEVAP